MNNSVTEQELLQLSEIAGYDKWEKLDRYFPETKYVPKSERLKTGVINLPPKKQKAVSEKFKMYSYYMNGQRYIVRTDTIDNFEREAKLAVFADRIFREGGVYVSSPVEVDAYCNEERVYSIYSFFGGDNLARRLPEFSTSHQHSFGVEAGKQLKKFHSVLPKEEDKPNAREDMFIILTRLEEKGIKYNGYEQAVSFLKKYHSLPESRPVTAVHGDFSANALFLDKDLNVGLLPIEKSEYDDPITDLVTLPDGYSLPFIKGVFKGLFEGQIPKDFFELLNYYSTLKALTDIDKAQTKEEMRIALARATKVAADYDGYQSSIPVWY